MLETGAVAPDIRLSDLDGNRFTLSEAGPVLLAFFKISCPTCQLTLPFLERLHANHTGLAPLIYGISQDSLKDTREFNQYFGITFPVLLDPGKNGYVASNAYRITNVPSMFLVEPPGRIAWTLSGFHKAELEALGTRFGASPFREADRVPAMRPG